MSSPDRDLGVITVLLQRLENDRLPTMFALQKKVDAGERLDDGDFEYLDRVLAEAKNAGLQPLLDRHPEYNELVARTFALYAQIIERALENENPQKG